MVRIAVALTFGLGLGCGADPRTDQPDAPDDGFDRRAMLAHLGSELMVPAHQRFEVVAGELPGVIGTYCGALDGGDATAERALAHQAWRDAIDAWERIDAVLVGPAAMNGKALRDRIYAWPLLATCGIDREITSWWAAPARYDVGARLANVRSLAAIEYLLFVDDVGHTCAAAPTGWDALGADLPRARCGLAGAIAADVAAAATLAVDGWTAAGGNYLTELVEAGTGGSTIPTLREAINVVSDAIFYVDSMVKGMKVGEAAGIMVNACGAIEEVCLREVEHRYADHGRAAILVNLGALREVFTGTIETADGPGFDDNLRALGATVLADRITASIDAAISAAEALPASYLSALTTQRADVVTLYAALKAITDDLKSMFLTVLGLDIPDDVAGDND